MFLIYVNDIVDIIKSEIRLFADDTTLYIGLDNPAEGANILSQDLLSMAD